MVNETRRSRRILRLLQATSLLFLAGFTTNVILWRHGPLTGFFDHWVYNGLVLASALSCIVRALSVRAERLAWALLGLGLSLWAVADITTTVYLSHLPVRPFPSICDAMWIAFYPASWAALVLLARARIRADRRARLWLDGLVAALATAAFAEVFVFQSVIHRSGGTLLQTATDLAYPVCDLLLLAVVVGVFALTGWRPGRAWAMIGAGLLAAVVADSIYAFQAAAGTYVEGTLLDALWPAATLLIGYAAWAPAGKPIVVRASGWRVVYLPGAFALIGLGLLVYDHFARIDTPAIVLAALTVGCALARTGVSFGDSQRILDFTRREALTDPLTGLGNRRRLMVAMLTEVVDATVEQPLALALFDLDGFKRYNDAFGHPAGDALLVRLGRNLEQAVHPFGRAYRLGGDEFCTLLNVSPADAETVLSACDDALAERGPGFDVGTSHGVVFMPRDTIDSTTAMQIADRRLYENKQLRRRATVEERTRDVLMQVLHESQPDLHEHLHEVAGLALAVGRRMGMGPDELDDMARAAELHDVGKMAIPEEILNKPGPLDAVEWRFIRQHTIVGERILATAPALSPVAGVVRASHENFDGSGYPDGLCGTEIPLASRIIAVCDAYDAMTAGRPYKAAVARDQAMAELRRCAGSHFDPEVVGAVCDELARQAELGIGLARHGDGDAASDGAADSELSLAAMRHPLGRLEAERRSATAGGDS